MPLDIASKKTPAANYRKRHEREHAQKSVELDEQDAAVIKLLLAEGFAQKRIAALFDVNQGRISEINSGNKFTHVQTPKMRWK